MDLEEVKGIVKDNLIKSKEDMYGCQKILNDLFENIKGNEDYHYINFFCGNPEDKEELDSLKTRRKDFYTTVNKLARSVDDVVSDIYSENQLPETEVKEITDQLYSYVKIADAIKLAANETIDYSEEDKFMKRLLNRYITAGEVEMLAAFGDKSILEILINETDEYFNNLELTESGQIEVIENNLRSEINNLDKENPIQSSKLSELLIAVIQKRRNEQDEYIEYLSDVKDLANKIKNVSFDEKVPPFLANKKGLKSIYDNLPENFQNYKDISLVEEAIFKSKQDNWRGHYLKEKKILQSINTVLNNDILSQQVVDIMRNQHSDY